MRSRHQSPDLREQLRLIELALDHVALRADLLPALDRFRRGERGDEDRRNVPAALASARMRSMKVKPSMPGISTSTRNSE